MKWFNFLDRWEYAIFKKYNENHSPVSKFVATACFYGAILFAIAVVIIQFAVKSADKADLLSSSIYTTIGCLFAITALKLYRPLMALAGTKPRIFFAVYVLLLMAILASAFMMLAATLVFVFIIVLVIGFMLYLMYPPESNGKKTIHYSDGTSEEAEKTGRGILGETYYKGKESGREFVE
jgi:hypothetical protein